MPAPHRYSINAGTYCTFQSIMYNEHITPTHYYIRHNINTFSTASAYLHHQKQKKRQEQHKRPKKTGVNEVNITKDIHFSMKYQFKFNGGEKFKIYLASITPSLEMH